MILKISPKKSLTTWKTQNNDYGDDFGLNENGKMKLPAASCGVFWRRRIKGMK
jgi:hypothetical protein